MIRVFIAVAFLLVSQHSQAQAPPQQQSDETTTALREFQAMATAANHVQDALQRLVSENQRLTQELIALRKVTRDSSNSSKSPQ